MSNDDDGIERSLAGYNHVDALCNEIIIRLVA
jgi:hypothetical protein